MTKKRVLFIADSVECAKKYAVVLKNFDIEILTATTKNAEMFVAQNREADLLIYELPERGIDDRTMARAKIGNTDIKALLVIANNTQLDALRMPVHVSCDFIVNTASAQECSARIRNLLYPGSETKDKELITTGNMTINLATYQVKVNDNPVDFTYLEYALLSFLVTHPSHSYSRDELLKRVWGFDYLGGSRTVDVHIRRIRAKIGPENANKLETVRGVGYLWNS